MCIKLERIEIPRALLCKLPADSRTLDIMTYVLENIHTLQQNVYLEKHASIDNPSKKLLYIQRSMQAFKIMKHTFRLLEVSTSSVSRTPMSRSKLHLKLYIHFCPQKRSNIWYFWQIAGSLIHFILWFFGQIFQELSPAALLNLLITAVSSLILTLQITGTLSQ